MGKGQGRTPTRLGMVVLDRMAEAGMTRQVHLVNRVAELHHEISEPTVSRILYQDNYTPDRATIFALAAALDIDPTWLVLFVFDLVDGPMPERATLGAEIDRMLAPASPIPPQDRDILATILDRVIEPYRQAMRRTG